MSPKTQIESLEKGIKKKITEYEKLSQLLNQSWLEKGKDIMVRMDHPFNQGRPYRTKVIKIEQGRTSFGLSVYIRPTDRCGFWISETECYPLGWNFELLS